MCSGKEVNGALLFARNNVKTSRLIHQNRATVTYVQNKKKAHFYLEGFSKCTLLARWTFLHYKVRNKLFSLIWLKFRSLNVLRLKSPCNCRRRLLILSIEFKPIIIHLRYRETFKVISFLANWFAKRRIELKMKWAYV